MSERIIKNALILLEEIGNQLKVFPHIDVGVLEVTLYDEDDNELVKLGLAQAVEYIAGDIYFDEDANWSNAKRAYLNIMGR